MATAAQKAREELVQKWTSIISASEEEFNRVVRPNTVTWDVESKFALDTIIDGGAAEYLQKASTSSLHSALVNIAIVGLTISPAMKLAYLVPRDGKVVLDISYMGLLKLATDTGSVLAAKAELVYEKDHFEPRGPFEKPVHRYDPFRRKDRGDLIGVYVIAKLATGFDQVDTLDMEEITKIKDKSKAKTGPWQQWFEEMVKKAAIKRAYKGWPRTEQLSMAEQILNEHEGNIEPINAGRGAAAAAAAQEQQAGAAGDDSLLLDEVRKALDEAVALGLDAYAAAWQALTKPQRQALAGEHTGRKAKAAEADERIAAEGAQQ